MTAGSSPGRIDQLSRSPRRSPTWCTERSTPSSVYPAFSATRRRGVVDRDERRDPLHAPVEGPPGQLVQRLGRDTATAAPRVRRRSRAPPPVPRGRSARSRRSPRTRHPRGSRSRTRCSPSNLASHVSIQPSGIGSGVRVNRRTSGSRHRLRQGRHVFLGPAARAGSWSPHDARAGGNPWPVTARNGEHGYGWVTEALHWLTVALVLAQFVVGYADGRRRRRSRAWPGRGAATGSGHGRGRGRETTTSRRSRCCRCTSPWGSRSWWSRSSASSGG